MRITNNYQSYYTKNATSTSSSSDSTANILSSLQSANTLFSKASLSSDETTSASVSDILSEMTSAPNAQQMRLKMSHDDAHTDENREKMKTMMDTLAAADLESMSLEEKQALMEEIKTMMEAIHGADENAVTVSDLTEEELTSMLTDLQNKAIEGPKGPGGKGVEGVEASSSSSEEDALTTLEALLEALSAAEEEEATEETSEAETESENVVRINEQTFINAIEQYFNNQNWDVANLKTLFEA